MSQPRTDLTIALVDAYAREIAYPGYARQPVTFGPTVVHVDGPRVLNAADVRFARFDEPPPDYRLVFGAAIYVPSGMLAMVAFSHPPIRVSQGMSPGFMPGEINIGTEHLSDFALQKCGVGPPINPAPLPTHCKKCNHHNPYIGVEHLNAAGEYVCRSCK